MDLAQNAIVGQEQVNLAQKQGEPHGGKAFTIVIQLTIALFTIALVWFSFVFYPNIVNNFSGVGLPQAGITTNAATFGEFPIETDLFTVRYEEASNTYYAFIEGSNLAVFGDNKNRATLALKSAMSLQNVCGLNVIYASIAKLEIPQNLQRPSSCL